MSQRPRLMHIQHDRLNRDGSFGAWLRYERERRNISIGSIAESTKILGALFEGLENDNLSRWPEGHYRRAFVRAYAEAIGLDPSSVVRDFLLRFPDSNSGPATPDRSVQATVLRLTLADTRPWFRSALVRTMPQRSGAASLDAAVIAVLSACLWAAFGLFWAPLGIVTCCYYSVSILVLGNTPGVCAFASQTRAGRTEQWLAAWKVAVRGVNQAARWWSFEQAGSTGQQIEASGAVRGAIRT